jgi:acyl-CoA synthetase (AMP-forming)/AMP-acid ligase II
VNIVDPILFQCRLNPHGPAICTTGTANDIISYGQLERMIYSVGRMALTQGLVPGNIAALFIKDKILQAGIILGLARLGIATVSGRNQRLPKELSVDAIICDGSHPFGDVARVIVADASWSAGDGKPVEDSRAARAGGGREGRVRIRGPYNAAGYVGDPETSATAFRDGWFYPGDIGSLTAQNLLVIATREKSLMNLGGDKIKPELIEDVLISFAQVEQAAVFSVTNALGIEEVWAIIVPWATVDEEALRTHCEQKLPGNFVPVRFMLSNELLRNQMGKIDRSRLPDIAKAHLH